MITQYSSNVMLEIFSRSGIIDGKSFSDCFANAIRPTPFKTIDEFFDNIVNNFMVEHHNTIVKNKHFNWNY